MGHFFYNKYTVLFSLLLFLEKLYLSYELHLLRLNYKFFENKLLLTLILITVATIFWYPWKHKFTEIDYYKDGFKNIFESQWNFCNNSFKSSTSFESSLETALFEVDPNFVKRNAYIPNFFKGHMVDGTFDEFLKKSLHIDLVDIPLSFFQLLLLYNI